MAKKIIGASGDQLTVIGSTPKVPKIGAVHPFGSKVLVEVLQPDEVLNTNLYVGENADADGAPQAYILELGPQVSPECGLKVGQRVYWSGKGTAVNDPRAGRRVRALLEVHNIQAIIEEEHLCCGGGGCE